MSRKKKMPPQPEMRRFIVDTRDASRDVWIDAKEAAEAYKRGEIALDATNGAYCNVNDNPYPPSHLKWVKR